MVFFFLIFKIQIKYSTFLYSSYSVHNYMQMESTTVRLKFQCIQEPM